MCGQEDEDKNPIWIFTSYDDNSLCDCGTPFIYHSRVIERPGTRTNLNDFRENLNDFFARPLEPEEKECFTSHGEFKNQPLMCANSLNPYPDPDLQQRRYNDKMKVWRFFTTYYDTSFGNSETQTLPSIPGSQCSSRPDISSLFSVSRSPYYPEKCDAGWFQVGNVCFKQFPELKSWLEAGRACQENNAELASIPDEETQSLVWSEIKYQNPGLFWIGGFTLLVEWKQEWDWDWSDGTYFRWTPNSIPPPLRGNCLAMEWSKGGKWKAVDCDAEFSFVCSRNLQI